MEEPEPEAQPEPAAPGHQLDVDLPMAQRSAAQVAAWIAHVLELPEDGVAATALRVEFEAYELDGEELEAISAKQLQAVLRRAGVPKFCRRLWFACARSGSNGRACDLFKFACVPRDFGQLRHIFRCVRCRCLG